MLTTEIFLISWGGLDKGGTTKGFTFFEELIARLQNFIIIPFIFNIKLVLNKLINLQEVTSRLPNIFKNRLNSYVVFILGDLKSKNEWVSEEDINKIFTAVNNWNYGIIFHSFNILKYDSFNAFLSLSHEEGIWFTNWDIQLNKPTNYNKFKLNCKYFSFRSCRFYVGESQNENKFIQALFNTLSYYNENYCNLERILFYKDINDFTYPFTLIELLFQLMPTGDIKNEVMFKSAKYFRIEDNTETLSKIYQISKNIWAVFANNSSSSCEQFKNYNMHIIKSYGPHLIKDMCYSLMESLLNPQYYFDKYLGNTQSLLNQLIVDKEAESWAIYGIVDSLSLIMVTSMFRNFKTVKIGMIFSIIINSNYYKFFKFEKLKVEYLELVCNIKSWGDHFENNKLEFPKMKGEGFSSFTDK